MAKIDLVWRHLTKRRNITSMQAWESYNVTRLADVVHKLRRHGYMVLTEPQRTGRTVYAKYRLV